MHGLLILLCLFSESFAAILSYATGFDHSLLLRICCAFTFFYSVFVFLMVRNNPASPKTIHVFFVSFFIVCMVLLSMFVTELKYGYTQRFFDGMVLSFGSKVLVAPFFAMAWNKHNFYNSVVRWILPFTAFFTFFMLVAVFRLGNQAYMNLEIGYQILSYAASFSIGLLFIYMKSNVQGGLFCYTSKGLSIVLIILNIYILLSGGGKGAFVMVIALFFLNFYKQIKIRNLLILFVLFFIGLINSSYISNLLAKNSGSGRILVLFSSSDISEISSGRNNIYNEALELIIDRCFLGNGTGSVLYDIGYYAHNMFLDILLDWGFIGLILCVLVLFQVCRKYFIMKNDEKVFFLFSIFLMSFIHLMFSGSFYTNLGIWFSVIAILCTADYKVS